MSQKTKSEQHSSGLLLPLTDAFERIPRKWENHPLKSKISSAQNLLEKLHNKFPDFFDLSCFRELDRIAANLEDDFILHRSIKHLTKLAYSIVFIRKKLAQGMTLFPLKDHHDVRIMPFSLHFTFGSKSILGILAHAYLRDKYEGFDEEPLLLSIRKSVSEAQLVKGSIYSFQSSKNGVKTVYFEINKKSGLPFSTAEIRRLKGLLNQEIKFSIEQLVPRVFMTRNEEEVLRNILTLSREIQHPSDIPQVMILFDRQTSVEAVFTIILVRVCQEHEYSITSLFSKIQGNFVFLSERCQIVRHFSKIYPVEANVFRISLPKGTSLLRADRSLNFYLARQKISSLLAEAIGEFRDYNGGIILKQRERLSLFMDEFSEPSCQNPDLLESFFYSLSPIEVQATLPLTSLGTLFQLFLEALRFDIAKSSDYFLKTTQSDIYLFLMVRISDKGFKETLDKLLSNQTLVVTSVISLHNTEFLGYVLSDRSPKIYSALQETLDEVLNTWQQKIKSQKTLKLGLEFPIVSLDPRIGGDQISSLILKMLFEGLMRENRDGKIEKGLAQTIETSSDFKTYLFKLRPSQWSDGSSVTAYDFEYGWKKALSPSFKTPFAYLFYPIKNAQLAKNGKVPSDAIGIQALDDYHLKVELRSPTPYFLELIAHPIFSPVSRLIDQLHPNWSLEEGNAYVCNGAFQLVKNQPNEGYELIKNSFYWDVQNIQLDQALILRMNRYQGYEMFQKGEIHWAGGPFLTWDSYLFVPSENDELIDFQCKSTYWCVFNCKKFPFTYKKLRQAFSLAVDRKLLASMINTQPIFSPLPAEHSLIDENSCSSYDPAWAKRLFEEALNTLELSREDFPVLTFIYLKGNIRNKICEHIQQSWQSTFGIQCKIDTVEWNELFKKITEGDYLIGGIGWQSWINDPLYTLNAFRDRDDLLNFAKWESSSYRDLLQLAEKEIDSKTRKIYYLQAEKVLLDEMPIVPILVYPSKALKKKELNLQCRSNLLNLKWSILKFPT